MTIGKGKRPRDTNQLAKFIVDVRTAIRSRLQLRLSFVGLR